MYYVALHGIALPYLVDMLENLQKLTSRTAGPKLATSLIYSSELSKLVPLHFLILVGGAVFIFI